MTTSLNEHPVVSRDEWLQSRRALLERERALTHERDDISRLRRELPWVKVEKSYVFEGARGPVSLADLFEGRSQLIVYHFMFGPNWEEGCPSCSYLMDHVNGTLPHLKARDTSFTAISRAPFSKLEPFRRRLGWKFNWVSSQKNDFNYDFHVTFTLEELARGTVDYNFDEMPAPPFEEFPGLSVFYKNATGDIFHTYSTFARGLDILVGTYNYLDLTPKGRDEDHLAFTMSWVRYNDRYDANYLVDLTSGYVPPRGALVESMRGTP